MFQVVSTSQPFKTNTVFTYEIISETTKEKGLKDLMERASDASKVNGHFVLPVGLEVTACSNTTTADVNVLNPGDFSEHTTDVSQRSSELHFNRENTLLCAETQLKQLDIKKTTTEIRA